MYLCIQGATAALCVALLLLLQLAAAAVRHRVPDVKNCCRGSLNLIPVLSFSSFKYYQVFNFYVPLGSTVAFTASICLL